MVDKESDVACSLELVMVIFPLPATLIAMVMHERILRTDFVPVNVISFTHNLLKRPPPLTALRRNTTCHQLQIGQTIFINRLKSCLFQPKKRHRISKCLFTYLF
jgi:hypothetical protein